MPPVIAAIIAIENFVIAALAYVIPLEMAAGIVTAFELSAVFSLVGRMVGKKSAVTGAGPGALDPARTLNVRDAAGTRKLVVGTVRIGGNVVFVHQTGTKNEYTHVIIVHASHECNGFTAYYLNGEAIALDGSGNVTSPAKWAGSVTVKTHLGTSSQTVDTDLQTAVGSGVWSNNHRLRGQCYSYLQYKTDSDAFQSGLPTYAVDLQGALLYDPRSSTTVWSANSALALRWYLTLDRNVGGGGVPTARIDDVMVIAAANICDESVNLNPSGTEPRYESNGVIDTAAQPGQIVDDLCGAMAGMCPFVSGKFRMRAGAHPSVVADFTDDDAIGAMSVNPRESARDCFNGVKGVYISDKTAWQPGDYPPVKNDTYMAEDGGDRIWHDVVLNFTTSSATAQRLSKIMLERSRQDITHTFPMRLHALQLMPGDVITRTSARYGWSSKEFEVVDMSLYLSKEGEAPTLGVNLTLRETAAGVWDWSNGEETVVDLAPNTTLVDANAVPTASGLTLALATAEERTALPRVKVSWTLPASAQVVNGGKTEIEFKKTSASDWVPWNTVDGAKIFDFINDLEIDVEFDVRIRHVSALNVRGNYSSVESIVAAPGVDVGDGFVYDGNFTYGGDGYWTSGFDWWTFADNFGEFGWGAKCTGTVTQLVNARLFPVAAGERYTIRAHVWGTGCSARIAFFDSANAEMAYIASPARGADAWGFVEAFGAVPVGAVMARAEVLAGATNDACDSVKITPIMSGVVYSDPSTTAPIPLLEATPTGPTSRDITLTCDDPAADIYYDLNGGGVTLYTAPFAADLYDYVVVYAVSAGLADSQIATYQVP